MIFTYLEALGTGIFELLQRAELGIMCGVTKSQLKSI